MAGSPFVYDLSGVMPSNAEEFRVGLGVVNYCTLFANCTGVSNPTPVFDNVRFGVSDAASPDFDNDGISDAEESAVPGGGDADGDTVQGDRESYVVSLLDSGGSDYVTWRSTE